MSSLTQARSGIDPENLQEVLDAESSPGHAVMGGQQQYLTPEWLATDCASYLPTRFPQSVLDPQCGEGALIKLGGSSTWRFGIDIDNRLPDSPSLAGVNLITSSFIKVKELVDELFPALRFTVINANPPFGKLWPDKHGKNIDSTVATWEFVTTYGKCGYFIANAETIKRLGYDKHPLAYKYEEFDNVWKAVTITIGVVWWKQGNLAASTPSAITEAWKTISDIIAEEKTARSKYNIYLDKAGYLQAYLSTKSKLVKKFTTSQIAKLVRIQNTHPLTMTVEKETRDLIAELVKCGVYDIEPEAKAAIEKALDDVKKQSAPIMPVTSFGAVAYADTEEALLCTKGIDDGTMKFTAGATYNITTGTYRFTEYFKRNKTHYNEERKQMYNLEHTCSLSGQDKYIEMKDDNGKAVRFMDRPRKDHQEEDFPESKLWEIFQQPAVTTIADVIPEVIKQNTAILRSCEMMAGYTYYPGQSNYLARVAAKDYGLIAAETGTGKTLMAISLLATKGPYRALIIAPQGTMRSSEVLDDEMDEEELEEFQASQWVKELRRFAPYLQMFELFSLEDYERIKALNGGKLPSGVYVSYYQAMFINGARESCPDTWLDKDLEQKYKCKLPPPRSGTDPRYWCNTIGDEKHGVRCILHPCLSTLVSHEFDMVLLDEAHFCSNLDSTTTQMLIRMQPKYRYALTATPIPNIITNLFPLMGWLCVPDWYLGGIRNVAWPYSRGESGKFASTFMSVERDHTEEDLKKERNRKWRGKCVKESPVISSPARLLKLVNPTLAYISKPQVNPKYAPPKIIDVRVPMGAEQAELYKWYLNRANIPEANPLVRARKQLAWLRSICADPAGFKKGQPPRLTVSSNMNPKVVSILEIVRDILRQGEQVVIVNSRLGITDTLEECLLDAGIPIARIDSTVSAEQHAYQANLFKEKRAQAMLMGIKCASAHSFDQCIYEIIGSIEYSFGPFHQAKGRIDRVNSRPGTTIYCILNKLTIEETMFDRVATKQDAATICLHGQRLPREFKPVDMSEILADSITRFEDKGAVPEKVCLANWPELRGTIEAAYAASKLK